jgi:methylmalonyl-CoA mutase N-terminal domain/subunit
MRDEFGAKRERSLLMRFHTQTAGVTLTAQQPEINVVRVALQAMAAVLGGTQSLHTNSLDEALALPSQEAATIALRTQQIIAHETGVANTIDPLGGSYFVEAQTRRIEAEAYDYFKRIDDLGGMLPAIEIGFFQREIAESAYRYQREIDERKRLIVGVNEHVDDTPLSVPLLEMDPQGYRRQADRLEKLRAERDNEAVGSRLKAVEEAARKGENLMPYLIDAVKAYATLGEITDVLREVYGTYQEPAYM